MTPPVWADAYAFSLGHSKVLGDWAYLRNYIEMTVSPPGGTLVRRSGYMLIVLRKERDGQWRLARDANLLTAQQ